MITTRSAYETEHLAAGLAGNLRAGSLVALYGDLGAGKTCFIRGLARGLAVTRTVHSPTFTLINEYPGRLPLFHMDLYRIRDADEALDFGLDDYLFGEGVCAIEWAERIEKLLPPHTIRVTMTMGDDENTRLICIATPAITPQPSPISS
jgi:tRNA threonylcarbamoyladenosine biosynthesis protein TsaE